MKGVGPKTLCIYTARLAEAAYTRKEYCCAGHSVTKLFAGADAPIPERSSTADFVQSNKGT